MTRKPYEPDRARQLRLLLVVVVVLVVLLLGWAALIVLGDGPVDTAVGLLVVPGVLLGLLAAGGLRALATGDGSARLWAPAAGGVAIVVALLLSRTVAGLLVGLIGVPLLLIAVLPGRDTGTGPTGGG
jgi:hypothetical protein